MSNPLRKLGGTYYSDVLAFHKKFDLPYYGDGKPPCLLDNDTFNFRMKFVYEELDEFVLATREGRIEDAADALGDAIYVLLGDAAQMRLPFDEIWNEIQRANMQKERATSESDPRSTRQHKLDVVKPEGFKPPDHTAALASATAAVVSVEMAMLNTTGFGC